MISFFQPFGCFFGSHELYRDRDDHGELVDRCLCCGHEVRVLQGSVVRTGPQSQPKAVLGQPKIQAVPAHKVSKLERKRA